MVEWLEQSGSFCDQRVGRQRQQEWSAPAPAIPQTTPRHTASGIRGDLDCPAPRVHEPVANPVSEEHAQRGQAFEDRAAVNGAVFDQALPGEMVSEWPALTERTQRKAAARTASATFVSANTLLGHSRSRSLIGPPVAAGDHQAALLRLLDQVWRDVWSLLTSPTQPGLPACAPSGPISWPVPWRACCVAVPGRRARYAGQACGATPSVASRPAARRGRQPGCRR